MLRARNLRFFVLLVLACFPTAGVARTVTEIISAGLVGPHGIAVDESGNAYVAGFSSDNAFKITPDGVITEIIDRTGDGLGNTLERPGGIAADDSGNVYVSDTLTDNAFRITPDGVVTEIIDSTGDGMGNTLRGPYAIAVDDSGNAYVTGYDSFNAFKIELCDTLAYYPLFESCLTGPDLVADADCSCPDDDADGDVDLFDLARFQRTFVGP